MPRLTLKQMRNTRLPQIIGVCADDTPAIASALNASEDRLLYAPEQGDEGWNGTWARVAWNVLRDTPYLTLGRWGARLMNADVCKRPVNIQNGFYEFLEFGNGLLPKYSCTGQRSGCRTGAVYDRGSYPTFRDLSAAGKIIRVRAVNALDQAGGKRVLIGGTDTYDATIYSENGSVTGVYLTLTAPFVDTPLTLNTLTAIQKDQTYGQVQFWEVDPDSGEEVLLLTMEPSEEVAGYRRYYLDSLPLSCCPVVRDAAGNLTIQVEAMVKLNKIPVQVDSDYLLIQNAEALIAECQSARYGTMDMPNAKLMAREAHKSAIRYLVGELAHTYGVDKPAVTFAPFGSATLERQAIGYLQ